MLVRYIILTLLLSASLFGKSDFLAIATGSKTGTYFQIGKDISAIFKKYDAALEVTPTKGSKENLDALTRKTLQAKAKWAIVQTDALDYYNFLHFKATKQDVTSSIKTLLPLYNEHIHIFSQKGKKVSFQKGSVIRIGIPSKTSGVNITAHLIENAYGVTFEYRYVNFKAGLKYLQDNKLDIYIDVISLPAKRYQRLTDVALVELPQNKIMDKTYIRTKFDKPSYNWLDKTISGYKVPNVIVTNRVDKKYNQAVEIFLKIILKNYKWLIQNGHPKWQEAYNNRTLKLKNMHPVAYNILQR